MTTSHIIEPTSTSQSLTFEQALIRAASAYEGHADHARLAKAVEIAKAHGITFNEDGTATVQGSRHSHHVNGTCDCADTQFHGTYCKHFMAVELTKMAQNHLKAHYAHYPQEQPTPWQCAQAPSSCTIRWEVDGIALMLTMRNSSDQHLFARLGTVLPRIKDTVAAARQQRRDVARTRHNDEAAQADTAATRRTEPDPGDDNAAHFCVTHDVPFTRRSKGNHVWYSHWDDDAQAWCRERR